MGLVPCPLSCPRDKKHESTSNNTTNEHLLHSESSFSSSFSASLSSQPSLPSVPSLTPRTVHLAVPTTTAAYHCISTFKGHSSPVFSLAISGNLLFSGSSDNQILLWNRSNGTNNIVGIANGTVKALAVSGDKLFSGHQDNKIRVWKKADHKSPFSRYECIAVLPTLTDRVQKLFSPGSYVKVRRHKTCTWVHHVDAVSALALSKDGSVLYSASWDRTFKVWRADAADFKCLESTWNAHDDAINAIAVSNDCVFTGSADKKIKIWKKKKQVEDKKKKHVVVSTLEKHKSAVNALALSKDGNFLYSGACDRSILVWRIIIRSKSKEEDEQEEEVVVELVGALRGHTKAILCLVIVEDLIVSGSADKTVRIWKRSDEEIGTRNNNNSRDCCYCCVAVLEGHGGPVKCLAACVESCSGDGDSDDSRRNNGSAASAGSSSFLVYSGGLDCDIRVWRACLPAVPLT